MEERIIRFSSVVKNTALMSMTAIYANFYSFIIVQYSEKLTGLKPNFRINKFISHFVAVAPDLLLKELKELKIEIGKKSKAFS
jgi:hypothetical protein